MASEKAENAAIPLQNAKHEAVLQAYFSDPERVGYRCYIGVYPNSSEAAAKTAFSRLLKNADFTARLEFLKAGVATAVSEKVGITVEAVITELAKLGFSNMGDYFRAGDDGVPRLRIKDLSRDQLAALQEVTIEEEVEGADVDDDVVLKAAGVKPTIVRKTKFKLYDKRSALVDIGKHLGAFKEKLELTGKDGGPIETKAAEVSDLEAARRVAFLLERAARSAPAPAKTAAAAAAKPSRAKKG